MGFEKLQGCKSYIITSGGELLKFVRKDKVIMPKSNAIFEKDDVVVFLSKREQLKEIENLFRISL